MKRATIEKSPACGAFFSKKLAGRKVGSGLIATYTC
jgi:hypothetical protein